MDASMKGLRQDFLEDDLYAVTQAAGVTGTVAVQARQIVDETEWLSRIAEKSDLIQGIVGWAPLVDPDVDRLLDRLATLPKIKAFRHVLHDEPDDFYILRDDFNRGVSQLRKLGLRYDLLIFERHLPQTIEFVDRHRDQIFIVDHIAKPRIRERIISPWRENLRELAKRDHVYCKISGMVTEADRTSWTDDDLAAYFDVALEAFGPARLMFGSDWPVLTLASSYQRWLESVMKALANLSEDERRKILHDTAAEAYGLEEREG